MTNVLGDPAVFDRMVALRRDLHQHPELSGEEARTAERIARRLTELGIPHRTAVAGHGIVADLPGPPGVPAVALRADMDALPILEETGLPFASVRAGVMHACGHDGHTSIMAGAAELLAREAALPAPVRLLFQPSEEKGTGAPAMIAAGALEGVGAIFGGHLDRLYDPGTIVVTEGPVNAATDEFTIVLTGPGGHGARPHESVDPIVAASLVVAGLQTIVARDVDPTAAAVVSVGRFHAGTAPNVLASRAVLDGTLRAQTPPVRAQLQDAVRRIAEHTAAAQGVGVTVTIQPGTPPVVNRAHLAALAREAAQHAVGPLGVQPMTAGNMGGEDFGFYLEHVPGCFVRFGARIAGKESFPAHSSRFEWDERAMAPAALYFRSVALVAGQRLAERGTVEATGP